MRSKQMSDMAAPWQQWYSHVFENNTNGKMYKINLKNRNYQLRNRNYNHFKWNSSTGVCLLLKEVGCNHVLEYRNPFAEIALTNGNIINIVIDRVDIAIINSFVVCRLLGVWIINSLGWIFCEKSWMKHYVGRTRFVALQ